MQNCVLIFIIMLNGTSFINYTLIYSFSYPSVSGLFRSFPFKSNISSFAV
jgi:hypothetical protein